MTFSEFQLLNDADQVKAVIDYLPIAVREDGDYTILLNKVDDFFVEIYFDLNETRVVAVKGIETFSALDYTGNRSH